MENNAAKIEYLLRLGDSALIIAQRVSEWCGHAPALEEDIAMANVGLDLIGQAQMWLGLAAEVEGKGRTADDLAFLRDAWEFRNFLLCERPNEDYAHAIVRQYLFDAQNVLNLQALSTCSDAQIAAIATKTVKEAKYHLDRSQGLVIALGDGTDESQMRMQDALDVLWPYAGEMFSADKVDLKMLEMGIAPDLDLIREEWDVSVKTCLEKATLTISEDPFFHTGGKSGDMHTEHLGHLLTSLQWLQRSYPGATW